MNISNSSTINILIKKEVQLMAIPKEILREHIIEAIRIADTLNELRPSTGYDLYYDGKRYPPKEIIRLASGVALGYDSLTFSGGDESNNFLINLGFSITLKNSVDFIGLNYVKNKRVLDKRLTEQRPSYEPIERGYEYHIPYYTDEDKYPFIASDEITANHHKELEESELKNSRRIWLVPANPNDYDIESAFSRYELLDWKRSYNYENGDILFMYVSGNIQKVRFKLEVIEGLVGTNDTKDNNEFWIDDEKYEQSKEWDYTRLRLVDAVDAEELSLAKLREHGLKGNIQGSMKLTGELQDYIMTFFKRDLTDGYYPDEVPKSLEEGKRTTITVNVYERNPIARKQCIEHYGVQCQICQLDFEDTYGEVGKDFIHVHHVIPLHEIQQDYIVDPQKDLIPVCPNCHSMLHRKENGTHLSIEQLRERLNNKYTKS